MKTQFILASNNEKKLREMRAVLSQLGIEVISQREAGLSLDVEETGATFAENAYLKAKAACDISRMPAAADDSGLMVDALNGAPGIYSARYGGGNLNDREKIELLLKNMDREEQRSAKFVSSIVCVFPDGRVVCAEETCCGQILRAPRGEGGFGYDPVFYIPELGKTMAELSAEEKNAISHRGKALRAFAGKLEEIAFK